MRERPRLLAVIPARGGSIGLPGKNIRPLAGKPLIAYAIETAPAGPLIRRVIVSTDDAKKAFQLFTELCGGKHFQRFWLSKAALREHTPK